MKNLIVLTLIVLSACAKKDGSTPKDSIFNAWAGPEIGSVDFRGFHYGNQRTMVNGCSCIVGISGWPESGQMRMSLCVPGSVEVGSMECDELDKEYFYNVRSSVLELCEPGELEFDPPKNCHLYY